MCVWVLISSQARGGFSSSWTTMRLIMQLYAPNGAFGDCLFVFVRSFVPPFSLPWFCLSVFGLLRADESRKREQSFNLVHFWGQDWAKSGNKQTKEHTKSVLSRSDFLTRAWYSLILVLRSHAREKEREGVRSTDSTFIGLPLKCMLWTNIVPNQIGNRCEQKQKLLFASSTRLQHHATPVTCSKC